MDPNAGGGDTQRWEIWWFKLKPGETSPDMSVAVNMEPKEYVLLDAGTLRGAQIHEIHEVNVKLNIRRKVDADERIGAILLTLALRGFPLL